VCCVVIGVLCGEDVAFGGVFRCSMNLQDKFGSGVLVDCVLFVVCDDVMALMMTCMHVYDTVGLLYSTRFQHSAM